jgi:hypothetical protein
MREMGLLLGYRILPEVGLTSGLGQRSLFFSPYFLSHFIYSLCQKNVILKILGKIIKEVK